MHMQKNNDHAYKSFLTEKGKDFQNAHDLYNEILSSKEKIKRTAPKRKKKETLLWKQFETNYRKDLEVAI